MRTTARITHIAAWLVTVAVLVFPGCTKSGSVPRNRGVFYQPTGGQLVLLLRGSGVEMAARAVPITGTLRPSFLVDLPKTQMADVHIGVDLSDNKNGPFRRVDATVAPVEGKDGAYTVRPDGDLPHGLCAIVVGTDVLSADKDNVYPFRIPD
jgi:hypothetical protein